MDLARHRHRSPTGRTTAGSRTPTAVTTWPPPSAEPVDLDSLYDHLAAAGLDYGPAFRGVTAAWRHNGGTVYAEIALPEGTDPSGHLIHPALLDAALHASALAAPARCPGPAPVLLDRPGHPPRHRLGHHAARQAHARPGRRRDPARRRPRGTPAASTVLATRPVTAAQLNTPARASLHELSWVTVPPAPATLPGPVALIGTSPAAQALAQALRTPEHRSPPTPSPDSC